MQVSICESMFEWWGRGRGKLPLLSEVCHSFTACLHSIFTFPIASVQLETLDTLTRGQLMFVLRYIRIIIRGTQVNIV